MNQNKIALLLLTSIIPLFANAATSQPVAPEVATAKTEKPLVTGKHSMIVTNNPWASKAAQQILNEGGNATDAAIAAAFVLGLTEPQSSGIGGGGYALSYHAKTKQLLAFDGREVAPLSATPNWFIDPKTSKPLNFESAMLSPLSVGVPSEVALFYKMHQQNGKLAWSKLLAPAIALARNGFPMSPRLYGLLQSDQDILKDNPQIAKVYFNAQGDVKPIGDKVTNIAYADTLHIIAKNPQEFYTGKIAHDIIETVNKSANKKLMSTKDLSAYKVQVKEPVCSTYRGQYDICSVPPSSSGGVTVQELLGIYARNYTQTGESAFTDINWVYNFYEASKIAFADRNQYLADPDFVKQPIAGLLNNQYLDERAKLVNESMALSVPVAPGKPYGADPKYVADSSPKPHGTTSLSIVDKDGNAVTMTVTVEHQFGSHLFTNGFFLNNELTDFSLTPTNASGKPIANRVEAGKRPRSSIAPTMVFDKDHNLQVLTGSPGGSQIICYVAKNLIQILDFKKSAAEASSSPNLCAANAAPVLENGDSIFSAQLDKLNALGESVIRTDLVSGETNIIRTNDGWSGAADPRREGLAIGN